MQDIDLIARITVPNYIRTVQISAKQREKYYEWNGVTIKSGSKKLLQKYINPNSKESIIMDNGNIHPSHLRDNYCIVAFKGDRIYHLVNPLGIEHSFHDLPKSYMTKSTKLILCESKEDGMVTYSMVYTKVIANETQAGKPRNVIINGQQIYNHTASPFTTGKIFDAIKFSYYEKFFTINHKAMTNLRNVLKKSYPLYIEMEIQDTIKTSFGRVAKDIENPGTRWDVGNRADPYMKTFLDFITMGYRDEENGHFFEPLIVDDDRLHISSGNNVFFTPIDDENKRVLVFHIYKDTRNIWSRWFSRYRNYIKI